VARFSAQRFRFPGVDVRARLFRQYPLGESASHVVGYLGRISQRDQERIDAIDEANDADRRTIRARTPTTTRAPTTSARSAWSRATRPSCTA
jgi:penicillin-binding protein 2